MEVSKMNSLDWEREWWGTCQNTFGEEEKQLLYARKMGLFFFHDGKSPYNIDMQGASVLDVGSGPASLLLKCVNVRGKVIDPLTFPSWVYSRYNESGLSWQQICAERMDEQGWDEVWIYNVLQHVENPQLVIEKAKRAGRLIRIFEWIDMAPTSTHPSILREAELNEWLGGEGKVEQFNGQHECYGRGYYGIFPISYTGIRSPSNQ